jgi:hypothetical protein
MSNYRYFSEEEVKNWSDKLPLSGLSNQLNSFNNIFTTESIRRNQNYKLVFSVSKNNVQRFENLLNRFLRDGFKVKIIEGVRIYFEILDEKILSELNIFQNREEHKYYNTDFVRFSYEFKNLPVLLLTCYCQILLDVINIIGEHWQFDADGKEICNIKYQLGSVVSLKYDKSDFIIESIEFLRENSERYDDIFRKKYKFDGEYILYKLLKIENNLNSQVLQFTDESYIVTSVDIIPNRDSRIDEILG